MPSGRCPKKKLVCAVTVLAVSAAQADTIYVDDDNCPGPGSGTVEVPDKGGGIPGFARRIARSSA